MIILIQLQMKFNESIAHKSRNPLAPISHNNTYQNSKKSSMGRLYTNSRQKSRSSLTNNRQISQCTFQPRINQTDKVTRSFDAFIKDQDNYTKSKQMKISKLRQEINRQDCQENRAVPYVGSMSKLLVSKRTSLGTKKNVYERLSISKRADLTQEEELFSPKILSRSKSMVRKTNVTELLYQDALRRQERQNFIIQSQQKQIDMMMSPKINRNTNLLVLKKIWNQLDQLISQQEIDPLIALSVLEEIFNVDLNPNKSVQNSQLVQKIVGFLAQNDDFGVVRVQKIKQFITIVVLGPNQNDYFDHTQATLIYQNFSYFYKQRIARCKKVLPPQSPSFQPTTLQKSNRMATSYRQKTCQDVQKFMQTQKVNLNINVKDGYTIQDLFIIDHMKKQSQNQRKKIQKQNVQFQQCTFKPDTSASKKSINCIKKKPKVTLKAPSKIKTLKTQNKTQQQANYITNDRSEPHTDHKNQMIFSKTKIRARIDRSDRLSTIHDNVKDVQKTLMRMSAGRQKRQMSQTNLKYRAYPKDYNWTQYQRDMHNKSIQNNTKLRGYSKN